MLRKRVKTVLPLFLLTLLSLAGLFYCIFYFSPSSTITFANIIFPVLAIMYTCLFFFCLGLFSLLLKRFIHGISTGIFVCGFVLLKTNHLIQPFLIILLLVLILSLEFAFWPKKKTKNDELY